MMNNYTFQLIFSLHVNEDSDQYLDALFEAGCDDAILGIGKKGFLAADFTRESNSAYNAITSAIKGVTEAIPHTKLIKAGPYIANLSEMAHLFGCTKQNLSKYARGESASPELFPCSIISGKVNYWYILDVALWLYRQNKFKIQKSDIDTFKAIQELNLSIEDARNSYEHKNDFLSLAKKVAA